MAVEAPERACVLIAKISTDSRRDMVTHLLHLATQIERGELGQQSISGGYSSGHILTYSESGSPTHDEYFSQLSAYLAEKERAAKETPAALDMSDQPMGDPHPADLTRNGQCPVCGSINGHAWNCALNQV